MVQPEDKSVSIVRQCVLLKISRSGHYYTPKGESPLNIAIMHDIDKIYTQYPFYGARRIRNHLNKFCGYSVSRNRIRRLMQLMGITAVYQQPKTTIANKEHKKYPYLLRDLTIDKPNQVWCTDITYIPIKNSFLYLVAIMDWHTRKVLSWRISNTMDTDFCVSALEEALSKYDKPEIFNTDQGSQFTSTAFTGILQENNIKISMDGVGRWMDNVFIERLWRSLKYENIYLNGYEDVKSARKGIGEWFKFYNTVRPHSSLDGKTPNEYFKEKLNVA